LRLDRASVRTPVVGDVSTVIEVYTTPPDYELEQWLLVMECRMDKNRRTVMALA